MYIASDTKKLIHQLVDEERPNSILAIGGSDSFRMGFFSWEQGRHPSRIPKKPSSCISNRAIHNFSGCTGISDFSVLFQSKEWMEIPCYDMLLVTDLFEFVPLELALEVLDILLKKTKKQILLLCPKLCVGTASSSGISNGVHRYHPVRLCEYDFTYTLLGKEHENQTQLYSFYPKKSYPKPSKPLSVPKAGVQRTLRLAYILPDQDITGGMKQLLAQIKEMSRRGHQVFVYNKSGSAQSALPKWGNVEEKDVCGQFVLKPNDNYLEHIGDVDAIILGWMEQAPDVRAGSIPIFLWEQGSSHLFGDFGKPLASTSATLERFRSYYQPPVRLLAVSSLVQTILKARFGRDSSVVFASVETPAVVPNTPKNTIKQILLVGNSKKEFKNFTFVIQALMKAKEQGLKFEVQWITPTQMAKYMMPKGLKVEYHIAPPQENLTTLYASADLFISHSLYEAFSLPPLEAMAAGTPVLAVNSGGIESYAVSGENCLLCEQGDMPNFLMALEMLLNDNSLRKKLVANGHISASKFSIQSMCNSLESNLY